MHIFKRLQTLPIFFLKKQVVSIFFQFIAALHYGIKQRTHKIFHIVAAKFLKCPPTQFQCPFHIAPPHLKRISKKKFLPCAKPGIFCIDFGMFLAVRHIPLYIDAYAPQKSLFRFFFLLPHTHKCQHIFQFHQGEPVIAPILIFPYWKRGVYRIHKPFLCKLQILFLPVG